MGENVTFINWGNIMIKAVNKGSDGKAKSVEAEQNIDNKDYKKTMKLTWLCKDEDNSPTTPTVLTYYDHIISKAILDKDDDFKSFVGTKTKHEVEMLGDPELRDLKKGDYVAADGDLGAAVAAQGDLVRKLKADKAPKPEIDEAVKKLLALKADFKAATGSDWKPGATAAPVAAAAPPASSGGSDIGATVAAQGDLVRKLKSEKAAKPEIDEAVKKLLALKADFKAATGSDWKPGASAAPPAAAKASSPPAAAAGGDIGAAVAAQGDLVRKLKADKAAKPEIDEAVKKLLALKADYKSATGNDWKPGAAPAPAAAKSGGGGGAPQGGGSR